MTTGNHQNNNNIDKINTKNNTINARHQNTIARNDDNN